MFFLLGHALLTLGSAWGLPAAAPLEIQAGYPVLAGVWVNGAGPYRMLLDTGAESTSLRPSLAVKSSLAPRFAVALESAAGVAVTPVAIARRMEAGGVSLADVEVLLAEPPQFPGGKPVDGVLGQSFLRRTSYWIHYTKGFIAFDVSGRLDNCLQGRALSLSLVKGRPAIPVRMGAAGERRLVLDSGASHVILTGPFAAQGRVREASFRTATASRAGKMLTLPLMEAGNRLWQNVLAGWLDEAAPEPGGLFPAHLLRSFYVSSQRQSVLVEPGVAEPCASGPAEPPDRKDGATETGW